MVGRFFVKGRLVALHEFLAGRAIPGQAGCCRGFLREGYLWFPLAGANNAQGSIAEAGKIGFRRSDQQGDELNVSVLLKQLACECGSVLEVRSEEHTSELQS